MTLRLEWSGARLLFALTKITFQVYLRSFFKTFSILSNIIFQDNHYAIAVNIFFSSLYTQKDVGLLMIRHFLDLQKKKAF